MMHPYKEIGRVVLEPTMGPVATTLIFGFNYGNKKFAMVQRTDARIVSEMYNLDRIFMEGIRDDLP